MTWPKPSKSVEPGKRADVDEMNYLAGYLERSGSLSIYTQKSTGEPLRPPTIVSAGIRVRLRDSDPATLNLVARHFGGKVRQRGNSYYWTAVNARAANLLNQVRPFLHRGTRKVLVDQLLEFHAFMGRKRRRAKLLRQPLGLSPDDLVEIAIYQRTLRALKGYSD